MIVILKYLGDSVGFWVQCICVCGAGRSAAQVSDVGVTLVDVVGERTLGISLGIRGRIVGREKFRRGSGLSTVVRMVARNKL